MKINLHITNRSFRYQSRILRETATMAELGLVDKVLIAATWEPGLSKEESLDDKRAVIRIPLKTRRSRFKKLLRPLVFFEWVFRVYRIFSKYDVVMVNPHSLICLPSSLLFKLFKGSTIVYDAHELETEVNGLKGFPRLVYKTLERFLIRFVDHTVVVTDSIADWYKETYNIEKVSVVRNIPPRGLIPQSNDHKLRHNLGISQDDLIFIYIGGLEPGRGIEMLLEVFPEIEPTKHLVFMGYGSLEKDISQAAAKHANIHLHPAVQPAEVPSHAQAADVAVSLIENTCVNDYLCLPNKLFESIISGVPVIASNFPEMEKLVQRLGCGWTTAVEKQSIKAIINQLDRESIAEVREKTAQARQTLSWENEAVTLRKVYSEACPV